MQLPDVCCCPSSILVPVLNPQPLKVSVAQCSISQENQNDEEDKNEASDNDDGAVENKIVNHESQAVEKENNADENEIENNKENGDEQKDQTKPEEETEATQKDESAEKTLLNGSAKSTKSTRSKSGKTSARAKSANQNGTDNSTKGETNPNSRASSPSDTLEISGLVQGEPDDGQVQSQGGNPIRPGVSYSLKRPNQILKRDRKIPSFLIPESLV